MAAGAYGNLSAFMCRLCNSEKSNNYVILPSISKVNATLYEGRAHLSNTISKLNACRNEDFVLAICSIVGGLESAARNATKIAGDMASETQQISQAFCNIPIDVQNAVSS